MLKLVTVCLKTIWLHIFQTLPADFPEQQIPSQRYSRNNRTHSRRFSGILLFPSSCRSLISIRLETKMVCFAAFLHKSVNVVPDSIWLLGLVQVSFRVVCLADYTVAIPALALNCRYFSPVLHLTLATALAPFGWHQIIQRLTSAHLYCSFFGGVVFC